MQALSLGILNSGDATSYGAATLFMRWRDHAIFPIVIIMNKSNSVVSHGRYHPCNQASG
jgi:hypothetical protein